MNYSFYFNGIHMSAYGLIVNSHNFDDSGQDTEGNQLQDAAVGGTSVRPQVEKTLNVTVIATDAGTLRSYIDSIKSAINLPGDAILRVDNRSDRYWMARYKGMSKGEVTGSSWTGTITFIAFDANAYDNTPTTSGPTTIDASPKSFNVVCASPAATKPVLTLTWTGGSVTGVTVIISNVTSGEAIQWTGNLANGDVLEFDTATMTIKLNGTVSMTGAGVVANVVFPQLLPGINAITVTALNPGTVTIVYPKRYS